MVSGAFPAWDQHPLTDARPDGEKRPGLAVVAGLSGVAVVGRHEADGWKVALFGPGLGPGLGPGRGSAIVLSPDQARALAAELIEYAELCEGRRW